MMWIPSFDKLKFVGNALDSTLNRSGIFVFGACISVFWSIEASAANLQASAHPHCDLEVVGTLVAGDVARMEQELTALRRRGWYGSVLCLNSPGGNFAEGVLLHDFVRQNAFLTALPSGYVCESACAIGFMGGVMERTAIAYRDPARVVAVDARLGFHAPSLVLPDQVGTTYDTETVSAAFNLALSVLDQIWVRATDTVDSGTLLAPFVLRRFTTTPADTMWHPRSPRDFLLSDLYPDGWVFPAQITAHEISNACDIVVTRYFSRLGYTREDYAVNSVPEDETPMTRLFTDQGDWVGIHGYYASRVRERIACVVRVRQDARLGQRIFDLIRDDGIRANLDVHEGFRPWASDEVTVSLVSDQEAFFSGIPTGQTQARRIEEILQLVQTNRDCQPGESLCLTSSGPVPGWYLLDPNAPMTSTSLAFATTPSPPALPSFPARVSGCWLASQSALVTNVNEYTNLRRQPDFSAQVIRQVPLGERVQVQRADYITVIGRERDRHSCINACQAFGRNAQDRSARDRAQQCIQDNMIWYEVSDARNNRGWVSRRYLEETQ